MFSIEVILLFSQITGISPFEVSIPIDFFATECIYLEDFAPNFCYCAGKENVLADRFIRLPRMAGKGVLRRGRVSERNFSAFQQTKPS